MEQKQNKNGPGHSTLTIYLSDQNKKLIRKAATADGRSVSNWISNHVPNLAQKQLKKINDYN